MEKVIAKAGSAYVPPLTPAVSPEYEGEGVATLRVFE
jgi:hypothetical protein